MNNKNDKIKPLSNKFRLKIINCLSEKERSVTDMINNCGLSQSAVSQHLKILRDHNIIDCKDCGRKNIYFLKNDDIAKVSKVLYEYIDKK